MGSALSVKNYESPADRRLAGGFLADTNYGHGKKNLAVVLPMLAMLSLLIDQTQQHCCSLVQKALKYQKRKLYFWEKMNRLFLEYRIRDWRTFSRLCTLSREAKRV